MKQQTTTPAAPRPSLDEGGNASRYKETLHLSRRIDWRFLLPEPLLKNVAFLGKEEKSLLDALDYFSEALSIVDNPDLLQGMPQNKETFDLLVLCTTDIGAVRNGITVLKPGGALYWEISRAPLKKTGLAAVQAGKGSKLRAGMGMKKASDFKRFVETLGFENAEVYWHRPNFGSCREIIPLEKPRALNYVFSQRGDTSAQGRLKVLTGQVLKNTGLLQYIVPCFSVVARKSV